VPGWLAWTAAGIAVVVGGLALLVQSPPATRWGRDWLIRQVATQWQLDLATSRLDLDPIARRVTLHDVRLSAPGHRDDPFFAAARVSASLPWAVFRGRVQLDLLEVDGGRVHLLRQGGVMVNLPPSSGKPPPEVPRRLDLRNVRVSWLDVSYEDRTGDSDVSVRGLRLMLDAPSTPPAPSRPSGCTCGSARRRPPATRSAAARCSTDRTSRSTA
jgi:hypothetical protein